MGNSSPRFLNINFLNLYIMGKIMISVDYDKSSIKGISQLDDRAKQALTFGNSSRLRKDLTYFIPRQWVHDEEINTQDGKRISKKVFVLGITDDNQVASVTTLSINGLRARHYGKVADNPNFYITCHQNDDKLWRADENAKESVYVDGNFQLHVEGDRAAVTKPQAFKVVDRADVYQLGFTQTAPNSGKWNVNVAKVGEQVVADLAKATVNFYKAILEIPEVEAADCIDDYETYIAGLD